MDAQNGVIGADWGRDPQEIKAVKRPLHGSQSFDPFGVTGWCDMAETIGMGEERDLHAVREQEVPAPHKSHAPPEAARQHPARSRRVSRRQRGGPPTLEER